MARNYHFSNYVRRFDDYGIALMSLGGANIALILLCDLVKTRDSSLHGLFLDYVVCECHYISKHS